MAYVALGATLDRGPKSHINEIRSAQAADADIPEAADAPRLHAPAVGAAPAAITTPGSDQKIGADAANSPPRRGGRIVKPNSAASSTEKKKYVIHDDPRTKHIPLDRGGKGLPRYMQETGSSKRMLSLRRAEQDARRYGTSQDKTNMLEAFREMQGTINNLKVSVYELQQQETALDTSIAHCLAELVELKQYEASDGRHETTRMRTARELEEYKLRMRKKIGLLRRAADGYEQELQSEEHAHEVFMANAEAAHTDYVRERHDMLTKQDALFKEKRLRNEKYMAQNGASIAEAEIALDFRQQEMRQLEHKIGEMKKSLAKEGGLTLHKAKLFNARQFQADCAKYHKIISHLQKQTCELSLELNTAVSERDALVEESKTYAL